VRPTRQQIDAMLDPADDRRHAARVIAGEAAPRSHRRAPRRPSQRARACLNHRRHASERRRPGGHGSQGRSKARAAVARIALLSRTWAIRQE